MVVRAVAGARLPLMLALLLVLGVRLGADDHFRTGGVFQDPFPTTPGSIIKADQRFHIGDPATLSQVHMFVGCHAGDTLVGTGGTIQITVPGATLTWDATRTPGITWQGSGGSKVNFSGYANANRTMVFNVLADFVPITDHFNINANSFGFANFTTTVDPAQLLEQTKNGSFELDHLDDGTIRVARPPSAFASSQNQSFSAGSGPVAMDPLTLQESSVAGNGAIWAQTGIRINIPAGIAMTWFTGDNVASCSGSAVTQGRISATPTVTFINGNRTIVIPVLADFQPSETVVISGLSFANFGGDSSGSLQVNLGTSSAVTTAHAVDTATKTILGLPTLLSVGGNQVFTVGDPATNTATLRITESPGSPKINTTDDIEITIPANGVSGSNFVFDQTVTQVNCSGTAVTNGHMLAVTTGVTYPGGTGKTVRIPVNSNFASGRVVDISGLRFTNFADASPAAALTLEVNSAHAGIEDSDNNTIAVGKPTISSAQEQVFTLGVSPVLMQPLTITDDPSNPRIFNGTQIRIIIPGTFNMTWAGGPSITPVTGLNTAVSYANGNKTLILTANAGWTGSAVVQGLNFTGMTPTSLPDNLELWMSAAGLAPTSFDDKIIAIGGIPTMTSTVDQAFTTNDPITNAANNTVITDSSSPSLQNGRTLQLVIPAGLNLSFVTGAPLPTGVPGAGTGTVGALSFPDAKTLNIPITADFAGSQTLSINGLRFTSFTAASQPLGLQLKLTAGGPVATTDPFKKSIGAPTISSAANQTFGSGDPDTVSAVITVREDNGSPIATPRIRAGTDIRIRIPSTFGMEFDPAVIPTLNVGAGTGTVTAVNFPSNKVMRLTVGLNFSANQTVTVTGAVFRNFTLSALDNLELEVNNTGGTANAFDDKTIKVGTRPTITSVQTLDSNGNGSIDHLVVRYSEDVNGTTTSVTKGTGFIIGGGSYTIALGAQDPFDFRNVLYTLVEKGLPDTGTVPSVRYVGASGNLTDVDDALKMNTVTVAGGLITDGAAPVITGFQAFDDDANGRLDRVVFTFSENIDPAQADIKDWTLVDADGVTNLLLGLTNAEVVILNNTVTLVLADNTGSAADPRYRYKSDGAGGTLADLSGNVVAVATNNHAPVANAGPDQTLPPTKVTLNGTGSFDPDGQNLSYVWSQIGGGTVTPTGLQTATPSFVTVTPDTYTFVLTVSDGLTATQDIVSVTILNVPPSAFAVMNQVGSNVVTPIITGELSSDINGPAELVSFSWAQVYPVLPTPPTPPPAGTPTITSANSIVTTITGGAPGSYVFEMTAVDISGNTSKSRVNVRLHGPAGFAPTANAGPDQVKAVGSAVTLDGRLSSTPAVNSLNYSWSPSLLFPGQQNSATPSFVPSGPGLYTFQLVVTDSVTGVASLPDSVTVLVHDPANEPPVAVAHKLTPSGNPRVGEVVTLDSTGSLDPEGQPLVYAWRQTTGPAAYLTNPSQPMPSFTPALSGTYEFELLVYDGVHISLPSICRFQVLPANDPAALPISVSAVATGTVLPNGHFTAGTVVTITGSATPVGQVTHLMWEQVDGPAVIFTNPSPSWLSTFITFTPPVAGRYVFRAYSLDYPRLLLDSKDIEVIVDSANVAPTANAGTNQTGMKAGNTITLDGSLSSADAVTFFWKQVNGTPVELLNGASATPTFVPPTGGTYIFELVVSDGTAASGKSLVEVQVEPAAQSQASGSGSSGGCGLLGLEPLLLLGLAALAARVRRS